MKLFFRLLFLFLITASIYFSLKQPAGDIPEIFAADKIIHLIAYFALMLSVDFSFRTGHAFIWKGLTVIFYSAMMEVGQSYVPGRESSMLDIIANIAGVLLYLLCAALLQRQGVYKRLSL